MAIFIVVRCERPGCKEELRIEAPHIPNIPVYDLCLREVDNRGWAPHSNYSFVCPKHGGVDANTWNCPHCGGSLS
jgi:hypothetical protein